MAKLKLLTVDFFHCLFFVIGLFLGILVCAWIGTLWLVPANYIVSFTSSLSTNQTSRASNMHNMSDSELITKALKVERKKGSFKVAKVAFMFLSHADLPLGPLWERFFRGYQGLYSIYRHTHPSFSESIPETSVFYGTRIPSQPVEWGTISMMAAERRLLANALLDPSNQRFVLLSESCIPLFDFKTTYDYLINANISFQDSFFDPIKDCAGRYNPAMAPSINITNWRKGSQWFALHRELVVPVVADTKYYAIFEEFCHKPCYVDEQFIPTLSNILHPGLNSNRTVTWVDWSKPGPHPGRFGYDDMTDEFLDNIRFGSNCSYNGEVTNKCFLFARKFHPSSLEQILRIAPVLLGLDP